MKKRSFIAIFEKAELMRFEQQINEEKKQRDKDLNYKKELCKQRVEINEKIDQKVPEKNYNHKIVPNRP